MWEARSIEGVSECLVHAASGAGKGDDAKTRTYQALLCGRRCDCKIHQQLRACSGGREAAATRAITCHRRPLLQPLAQRTCSPSGASVKISMCVDLLRGRRQGGGQLLSVGAQDATHGPRRAATRVRARTRRRAPRAALAPPAPGGAPQDQVDIPRRREVPHDRLRDRCGLLRRDDIVEQRRGPRRGLLGHVHLHLVRHSDGAGCVRLPATGGARWAAGQDAGSLFECDLGSSGLLEDAARSATSQEGAGYDTDPSQRPAGRKGRRRGSSGSSKRR